MKDEKKVTKAEEVKKEVKEEVKTEEKGTPLTDEEMAQVNAAGIEHPEPEVAITPDPGPSMR